MNGRNIPLKINCKGSLIDLNNPKVMGIINATPDSFYDGGVNLAVEQALETAGEMLEAGATFLDIGGYSSRPGADDIPVNEEIDRVVPIIEAIISEYPEANISIDTFRSSVARAAIESGAALINDISGGHLDKEMLNTVADLQVPYIMMHMRGTPQTMKTLTNYDNLLVEIKDYFAQQLHSARALGINDVIIDPGFGFAKTVEQNFELLNSMQELEIFEIPLLAGVSRKSMIYKTLGITAKEALNGTTALNMIALDRGASILRVHDVAPAMECIALHNSLGNRREK